MPTLLQINECLNLSTGSIAQGCVNIAVENGWVCYFAYSSREPIISSNAHLIKVGAKWNAYLHYLESVLFDREGLASRCATKRLIKQIHRISPDIIHLHSLHDHWLNYKLLFEYLNNTDIKVVWTLHDFWPITGHCMHFITKDCNRWETECYSCPMQKEYPYSLKDRSQANWELKRKLFVGNKNLTIVPVSQWVGDIVRRSFLKEKNIRVINNGIDLNVFHPTSIKEVLGSLKLCDSIKNKFIILAVASEWKTGKGFEDYLAMSEFLKDDELIVLVGVNDDIINKLPTNIIGIKRTSNPRELAAYYSRADVVCSFSSAETFGLTIAEANACGTPVVVYNNTAQPYLVTPETGFVVPDGDYKAAYKAIQKIRAKGKESYSASCISLAKVKYDKQECFKKYLKLYNDLVDKK